jgi:hypothetical protein
VGLQVIFLLHNLSLLKVKASLASAEVSAGAVAKADQQSIIFQLSSRQVQLGALRGEIN